MKPTFKEAFSFWLRLGFISFGGPAGQIAIMYEYLSEKKKWISEPKFMHALNYCMLLPGPEAQQLATYIGWLLHGTAGGLTAGILFVLPSVFILLGLSILYVTFGMIPWVHALFSGLQPAVIAVIVIALIRISRKSLHSPLHYLVAFTSFGGMFFLNLPFPLLLLAAVFTGIAVEMARKQDRPESGIKQGKDEEGYYLTLGRVTGSTGSVARNVLFQVLTGLLLWILPFILFRLFSSDFPFWQQLGMFFTKSALVTFGGAYAVLPYVAQFSVEKVQWLSATEMTDGLALGESTPGPLVMVLAFVGFMAGFHHGGGSLISGSIGLAATAYFTFLPCFLFIFIGAPFIERTQHHEGVKRIMSYITAAVSGVILHLTIYLGKNVLFAGEAALDSLHLFSLCWLALSLVVLHKLKWNMMRWLLVSAVAGVVFHLVKG